MRPLYHHFLSSPTGSLALSPAIQTTFALVAVSLMVLSGTSNIGTPPAQPVTAATQSASTSPSGDPFVPYAVSPTLFNTPANATYPGNFTLPKVATTEVGPQIVYFLLYANNTPTGSTLELSEGYQTTSVTPNATATTCSGNACCMGGEENSRGGGQGCCNGGGTRGQGNPCCWGWDEGMPSGNFPSCCPGRSSMAGGRTCCPSGESPIGSGGTCCGGSGEVQGSSASNWCCPGASNEGSPAWNCCHGQDSSEAAQEGATCHQTEPGDVATSDANPSGKSPPPPTSSSVTPQPVNVNSTQPILWTPGFPVATYSGSITADALEVNGTTLAAAASSGGQSYSYLSTTLGSSWNATADIPGGGVGLALTSSQLVTSAFGPDLTVATTVVDGLTTTTASMGAVLDASPIALADGEEGAAVTLPNASLAFYSSTDGGLTYSMSWLGAIALASTSPIFDEVGETDLAVPGGISGEVTAASSQNYLALLCTTSVNGRVVGAVMVSSDGGVTWGGPFESSTTAGSLEDPALAISPVGYLYATWLENSEGTWRVDQAIFHDDGSLVQSPTPLPVGTGTFALAAGAPTVTVDLLERPLYAWAVPTSAGSQIVFSTGMMETHQAFTALDGAIEQLQPGDFANQTTANASRATLLSLSERLGNLTDDLSRPGVSSLLLQDVEQELYPELTSLPVEFLCSMNSSSCGGITPPSGSSPIADLTGPFVANKYLAVYADWILTSLGVNLEAPVPDDPTYSNSNGYVSASAVVVNPITAELSLSSSIGVTTSVGSLPTTCSDGSKGVITTTYLDYPEGYTFSVQVRLDVSGASSASGAVTSSSGLATLYVSAITPGDTVTYFVNSTASTIQRHATSTNSCTGTTITTTTTLAGSETVGPVEGEINPEFAVVPTPPTVQILNVGSTTTVSYHWNTTILAKPISSFNDLQPLNGVFGYALEGNEYFAAVTAGTYPVSLDLITDPGCEPGSPGCSLGSMVKWISAGGSTSSPSASYDYSTTLTVNPANPTVTGLAATDVGPYSATLTWNNYNAVPPSVISFLNYSELGSGLQAATVGVPLCATILPSIGCLWTSDLIGLSPTTTYIATAKAVTTDGNLQVDALESIEFTTAGVFTFTASDLPYDSITQEGGGENIQWHDGSQITSGGLPFVSGYLDYYPVTSPSSVVGEPIESLQDVPGIPGQHQLNLSAGLSPNTEYALFIELNYTEASNTISDQSSGTFTYLKDTSGDGLADSEKEYGWEVTYTDLQGSSETEDVMANPDDYATNGLVSDYVEKEFGLDPNTLDTAGSHMLDTWNLTFSLDAGVGNASIPTGFEIWFENTTFHPYAYGEFPGAVAPLHPLATTPSNFTGATSTGPDSSAWASNVLWTYSDLQVLEQLLSTEQVGWLRAVMGSYHGQATLTVWGKLSWGANPLATSTPDDGIADGARVNPVHEVDLQVFVPYAGDAEGDCDELAEGDGLAVRFYVNATTPGTPNEFQGYSAQAVQSLDCISYLDSPYYVSDYSLIAPIQQTSPVQTVSFQLVANTSSCAASCHAGPFVQMYVGEHADCTFSQTYTVNAVEPALTYQTEHDNQNTTYAGSTACTDASAHGAGEVQLSGTVLPAGTKDPTYLVVPSDNSTVSDLPQGLQRYTGEQDFVQVTVNFTSEDLAYCHCEAATATVPDPWGDPEYASTYTISATQGLVNFLIPRGQFLDSPLGQAVLGNTTVPDSDVQGDPLLGATQAGLVINDGTAGATLGELECYWENDAVEPGGFSTTPCSLDGQEITGTSPPASPTPGSTQYLSSAIKVVADTQNCTTTSGPNCAAGGVPSNPSLEAGESAPALEAVLTLNLSLYDASVTLPSPAYADGELDALIAALLDNSTGGLNGTLVDVTNELPSLGINPVVMSSLANATYNASGVFMEPTSLAGDRALLSTPSTLTPHALTLSELVDLWNSVCGLFADASYVLDGLQAILGTKWSAALAAEEFFDYVGAALLRFVEDPIGSTIGALQFVGSVIQDSIDALARTVLVVLGSLLDSPIRSLMQQTSSQVSAIYDGFQLANQTGNPRDPAAVALFTSGISQLFLASIGASIIVNIGITVALPVEPIVGPVAILIPTIVALALGVPLASRYPAVPTLSVGSPQQLLSTIASAAAALLDPGCTGTQASFDEAMLAVLMGSVSVIFAGLLYGVYGGPDGGVTLSLALALMGMLFDVLAYEPLPGWTAGTTQVLLAIGTFSALLGFGLDLVLFILVVGEEITNVALEAIGVILDALGFALGGVIASQPC